MDIIYSYTWDNAIEDGIFVEVTGLAKSWGYTIPVAITNTLFCKYIKGETEDETNRKCSSLLLSLYAKIKSSKTEGDFIEFFEDFENSLMSEATTKVWAKIEGRSPKNPAPVMTIMLPEDY